MSISRLMGVGFLIIFLLVSYDAQSQYSVTGGAGSPLLAERNTNNDIDIYLVNGMDGIGITYTSASTSHQWFRYKTKALEAEPVVAEQNGSTSVLRNVEEGYGYFVKESAGLTKYVWIVDYSKYKAELNSLRVSEESGCDWVIFEGDAKIDPMYYYTPLGARTELKREFELKFNTLKWMEEGRYFELEKKTVILNNPFTQPLDTIPYTDTQFVLSGDLFARHFNMEQTVESDMYMAIALDVHVDTTYIQDFDREPKVSESGEMSAPAHIVFTATGNEPVANRYAWKVYDQQDSTKFQINFNGSELDYVFDREGTFAVELTVFDRTGTCVKTMGEPFLVKISNFFIDVPNAFSPGSSPGINDEFKIVYQSIVSFKGWIFNRWGNEIFHWTNPDIGWDGKKGGKYVSPGVYFYIMEAKGSDGKTHIRKGSVNILRPKTLRNEVIE